MLRWRARLLEAVAMPGGVLEAVAMRGGVLEAVAMLWWRCAAGRRPSLSSRGRAIGRAHVYCGKNVGMNVSVKDLGTADSED